MVDFINVLLSYLVLMIIIVVVAGCGLTLGIYLRKRKNNQEVESTMNGSENVGSSKQEGTV